MGCESNKYRTVAGYYIIFFDMLYLGYRELRARTSLQENIPCARILLVYNYSLPTFFRALVFYNNKL